MKKLFICLISILCIGLVGCGNKETPTETSEEVSVVKFDCFEYDITNSQLTENILLSVNLTNQFEAVPNESLIFSEPNYYIGDYRKKNENGETERTIQIYEYTDETFNISEDTSKVSNSWSIGNYNLDNNNDCIRKFYSNIDNYIVVIEIANNNQTPLTISDSLQLLTFMTGEETHEPTPKEDKSITVEGTKESPAKPGEWISTTIYNKDTKKYEPVCICITQVYVGDYANRVISDYNNELIKNKSEQPIYNVSDPSVLEYVLFEYSIYFPNSYNIVDGKINAKIPISICNLKDDGKGIDGFLNLDKTVVDISNSITGISNGTIWTEGVGFYEMSIDFDSYLIKIESEDKMSETKYYKP